MKLLSILLVSLLFSPTGFAGPNDRGGADTCGLPWPKKFIYRCRLLTNIPGFQEQIFDVSNRNLEGKTWRAGKAQLSAGICVVNAPKEEPKLAVFVDYDGLEDRDRGNAFTSVPLYTSDVSTETSFLGPNYPQEADSRFVVLSCKLVGR